MPVVPHALLVMIAPNAYAVGGVCCGGWAVYWYAWHRARALAVAAERPADGVAFDPTWN